MLDQRKGFWVGGHRRVRLALPRGHAVNLVFAGFREPVLDDILRCRFLRECRGMPAHARCTLHDVGVFGSLCMQRYAEGVTARAKRRREA